MELQYETTTVLKHILCFCFWRHSKRAPSIDQNPKGILTPGKRVQQASFDDWNTVEVEVPAISKEN